jgi:hypothetical protein
VLWDLPSEGVRDKQSNLEQTFHVGLVWSPYASEPAAQQSAVDYPVGEELTAAEEASDVDEFGDVAGLYDLRVVGEVDVEFGVEGHRVSLFGCLRLR